MKTIIIESTEPLSWYFVADSALINAGKPFFIPEFADEFEAFLAPVVRISRIGKTIGARFAERYFTEIAPGIHFRASTLRRSLLEKGLPTDPSHSFDRSFTIGSFIPAEKILNGQPLVMSIENTDKSVECDTDALKASIGPLLEAVSRTNTIKMGDFLVPLLSEPLPIKIGDILKVTHSPDSSPLLSIHIK